MFNYNVSFRRFWNQYGMLLFGLCLALVMVLHPSLAHATDTDGSDLPFVTPLAKLTSAIQGPVAFAISLIGIIAAGAVLIFGGEMSGFLRTLIFLVLVIAIIVNASNLVTMLGGSAAVVAGHGHAVHMLPFDGIAKGFS